MSRLILLYVAVTFIAAHHGFCAEPIRIGVLVSASGSGGTLGREVISGIRAAHSLQPRVLERPVKLTVVDPRSEPANAAQLFFRLVEQNRVCAVIGDVTSSCTLAAAPHAQRTGTPLLSLSGPLSQGPARRDFVCWTGCPDIEMGERLARVSRARLGAKTAAIVVDNSQEYSVSVGRTFRRAFVRQGGKVAYQTGIGRMQRDLTESLQPIKDLKPDLLFVALFPTECALLVRRARSMGITATIVSSDSLDDDRFLRMVGPAGEGVCLMTHTPNVPAVDLGGTDFRDLCDPERSKIRVSWARAGAVAYLFLVKAIQEARSTHGHTIRKVLESLQAQCSATHARRMIKIESCRFREMTGHVLSNRIGRPLLKAPLSATSDPRSDSRALPVPR